MTAEWIAAVAMLASIAAVGIWTDVRERRLPNWLCLINLIAGLGALAIVSQSWVVSGWALLHAVAALAAGFALASAGAIGAGDAKYYASMAGWFPIWQFMWLLVSVALAGLLLLVLFLIWRRVSRPDQPRKASSDFAKLPYGVAIGFGGLAGFIGS